MPDPGSPPPPPPREFPSIGALLKRMGVWLDKRKGQHYLRDQYVCRDIAELCQAGPGDFVVEVGAGTGNLSVELAARAGRVLAVELDDTFSQWHDYLSAANPGLSFLYGDFLQQDLAALCGGAETGGGLVGAGNLPYQITSEILFRFLESGLPFRRLVFMVQKEVAERLAAGPGRRKAGALTYKLFFEWDCRLAFEVPPEAFLPPPRVYSAVVVLEPHGGHPFEGPDHRRRVHQLLDGIFRFRRKTLLNCLTQASLAPGREEAAAALDAAGLDAMRRPETLSLDEVLALDRSLRAGGGQ